MNTEEVLKSDVPQDAKTIALILKSMGIEEYEPRVINQLLDFMHKYTKDIFEDSVLYAEHANRSNVNLDDIRLSIQSKVDYSFTQPPPREVLLDLAKKKNKNPLPVINTNKFGIHLPPEKYCLTAQNYQVTSEPPKKKRMLNNNMN
eukprot:TRINITY_DN376_c0_g1_i1.p1 TRINITY_DN376_c0_g1~~TRINITY_DN376_c0_g1_i1.p1  ORF type:complete len:146 (+),score=35.49 TRINITY_DN376_c0_g1_i1:213-650(+)